MEGSESERQRLPAGAHGIPAEVVARNQRERLVAAVAEACAEKGYAETSVADLAQRAGVSTATFYKLFAGKEECALEAHRELSARLLEEVDRACAAAAGRDAKVRAGVVTVLELFAADAPAARLLTVEVHSLGVPGSERHDAALAAFAARLAAARQPIGPASVSAAGESSGSADWIVLAGAAAAIGRRVMAGEAETLPALADELVALLLARA